MVPVTTKRVLMIGASADSGFLNMFRMNEEVPLSHLAKLLIPALFCYVPSLAVVAAAMSIAPKKSRTSLRKVQKKIVADFLQRGMSVRKNSIFQPLINWISESENVDVEVTDYTYPLAGLYNMDRPTIRKLLSGTRYDVIFLHLGGNDVLQDISEETIREGVEFLAEEIAQTQPTALVVHTGVHNMRFCFFDKRHVEENRVKLPFGKSFSVGSVHKTIGYVGRLIKTKGGKKGAEAHIEKIVARITEVYNEVFTASGITHQHHLCNYVDYAKDYETWRDKFSLDGFHPHLSGSRYIGETNLGVFREWYRQWQLDLTGNTSRHAGGQ